MVVDDIQERANGDRSERLQRRKPLLCVMNEDLRTHVRRFGFTEKETDTYLTVLENSPATITEVAEETDISKRHVYNVATKLQKRQFVIVNDYFTPTTIEATPPEEVYESVTQQTEEMYQQIEQQYQRTDEDVADLRVLQSRSTVVDRIVEMLSAAEHRIALSIPANVLVSLQESLREAVDRGVTVLLLVFEAESDTGQTPDLSFEGLGHAIRYRDVACPVMLAVDRTSALVGPRGALTQPTSQVNAVFFGQPYLESVVFTSLINTEWENATEIAVVPPSDLPRTHVNFRRTVIDATLHRHNGTSLRAEIEARPQDNPETVVDLAGDVAEVRQRLITPTTDPPPSQCAVCLRTDDGIVTIGGRDAHMEDYRAFNTTLVAQE